MEKKTASISLINITNLCCTTVTIKANYLDLTWLFSLVSSFDINCEKPSLHLAPICHCIAFQMCDDMNKPQSRKESCHDGAVV